ncbi:carboxymuconolactone decarboxylase family protein [Pseudomonas protegens]|uniref:carboxymuconolactone decarboxylase family protein n=1 Tax=Pseudomonas protegens TaxID=380021 RepID=UPI000CDA47E4|nr:carboxymuconolactone decarboxylase family protein [Pseudomonas protegens]MDP9530564.1 carboxymuconolactone decarboxylase family protein [Pseudomonas protegens]RBJ78351.1 carboxymuconolactone decarboxylase family protein [Pseudomonas sp. MWU12-2534b]
MRLTEGIGSRAMGPEAEKLSEITDSVLFGDVWLRPELSLRDRSVVTVSALIAMYRKDELEFHFKLAIENGVSRRELIEIITHLAFYSGWPTAHSALKILQSLSES